MIEREVMGGRQVFVEDRSAIDEAARQVVENPGDEEAAARLAAVTEEIIVAPYRRSDNKS
jgi:hypothetical protein